MSNRTPHLPITAITVGERRREELGDIAGLMRSIERYGLLHPIVVSGTTLVAGGRRLEAMRRLGYETVPVTDFGDLDEATLREIELEENLRRKDLTPFEKSKEMLRRAEQFRKAVDETQPTREGRPAVYGTPKEDVAAAIGVSKPTLVKAEQHVAAVTKYPELEQTAQADAIEAARELDVLPEPEREQVREQAAALRAAEHHATPAPVETAPAAEAQPADGASADDGNSDANADAAAPAPAVTPPTPIKRREADRIRAVKAVLADAEDLAKPAPSEFFSKATQERLARSQERQKLLTYLQKQTEMRGRWTAAEAAALLLDGEETHVSAITHHLEWLTDLSSALSRTGLRLVGGAE